jgi:16S rRNA (cytosine967-C5)-methyltransferase
MINAILRRHGREPFPVSDDIAVASSHPDWLVERLREDWPSDAEFVLAENNVPAPLWLRVNTRRVSRTELLAAFRDAGIDCEAPTQPGKALCLRAQPLDTLPGWSGGKFSVQDGAAQLAVEALAPKSGERILDACAAPGGKSRADRRGTRRRLLAGDGRGGLAHGVDQRERCSGSGWRRRISK